MFLILSLPYSFSDIHDLHVFIANVKSINNDNDSNNNNNNKR